MRYIINLILLLPMILLASREIVQESWETKNSPYIINKDIEIPSNTVLVIESGVEIVFSGDYEFKVDGYIKARGEYDKKIVFRGLNNQKWKGIRFNFQRSQEDTIVSILNNCHILNSYAPDTQIGERNGNGGAVHISKGNKVLISDCTIEDNDAENSGGAIYVFDGSLEVRNCIIRNNKADNGGAIYSRNSNPILINNTIINNLARKDGGAIYTKDSYGSFVNTIFWGNSAERGKQLYLSDAHSNPDFYNCDIEGGKKDFKGPGAGVNFEGKYLDCIDKDPLINESEEGIYYSLLENSPCINSGIKNYGHYSFPVYDIVGNRRVNQIVDIGSVEYYSNTTGINERDEMSSSLIRNYPNPFNGFTTINFILEDSKTANVEIYNNSGKVIKQFNKRFDKGENSFTLDFNGLSTGIYYLSIKSKDAVAIKKLHYIK
ncbi:MAG: hypothetical protein CR982_01665 [Candidatus Cloacimonadota bacterium]|nr:MAG: hypothetical protein CR982_01665 [Candidatus Cloacimonadota bacterium]PIE82082.1 MAG: hypothetical protein CSA15_00060 [Candidatus Delongbacteria bacterium]